jgi:proteasome accessory factor C
VIPQQRQSGAANQVRRLLNLVPYLIKRPGTRVDEVAAAFGVSEDQVVRDLRLLWFCGLPEGLPGDLMEPNITEGGAIFLTNVEAIVRPLRLSTREAVALLVALRALAQLPGLADGDALARASAKLAAVCGDDAAIAERVSVSFEARDTVLDTVQRALTERRMVHLRYYVPSRDDVTERDVAPMRVALIDGRGYLEAWCRSSEGVRLFRLDRVEAATVLDEPAVTPEVATTRDLDGGLLAAGHTDPLVTLEIAPAARWITENYPCESVEELPSGRLLVRLRATDTAWVHRLVLRLGPQGRVVDAPELAAHVRDAARAALAAYDVPEGGSHRDDTCGIASLAGGVTDGAGT